VGESPTLGDVIRRFGDRLRERRGGALTPAGEAVLSTLERCHTAALGGHVYRCDACHAEVVAYHGCGNRHCPSCLGHKSAEWLEARARDLLPVPYFHVVFTVPDEVGALALGNKKEVYSILYRAASETLLEIAADPKHLGAEIGFLAILHTWTQTLVHHPHIHCVVPGGGLAPSGDRFVKTRARFLLPILVLSRVYRGKFLAFLDEAHRDGRLQYAGATAGLATPRGWSRFMREQRAKEWVVYAKPPFGSPEQVLKYLARYTHKVAISNRRLVGLDDEVVRFTYRDRKKGVTREMALPGEEFLRRFLQHVLPTGFVRIRYFGFMAHRSRREKLARCRALLKAPPPAPAPAAEREAAAESKAPACPACGIGPMRFCGELEREEPHREPKRSDTS
jgi:hypothetical protein